MAMLFCVSPAMAQEPPARTAETVFERADAVYGPPPPEPDCPEGEEGEIVVCGQRQEQSQFRVQSSSELDPESEQALNDGLPRAPDFAPPPCVPSLIGFCPKLGAPPPPALIIDVAALPEAPPGSDADRIARGLAPLGKENGEQPE